jgi:hypothetical protein
MNKGRVYSYSIHHNGCLFRATEEMATIFVRHVRSLLETGQTELVPLSHADGVELLLIGANTKWMVARIEVGIGAPAHATTSTASSEARAAS